MRTRAGFALIEVIVAMALAFFVLAALFSLMTPLASVEAAAMRSQTAQLNLAGALSVVERELRQATYVRAPAAGATASALEGCANAAVPPGGGAPAAIDPSRPMSWFAFCTDGTRLYYHAGSGACPPAYRCGTGPAAVFAGGSASTVSASFARPSALTTVIQSSLSVASGGQTSSVQSEVAFAAAAGSNQ